ncbi:VUT family protein (plasmid) [Cereibacter azotoformans]|uniref:VUT family protein n=1 Tax=Cereibacter azotoformans TaxID=43057 RepID=UPI003B213CDD
MAMIVAPVSCRKSSILALIGFLLTGPVSNWLIQNIGTTCILDGPCLIPVFPGVTAPSGVLIVGFALVLRDVVHRDLGPYWALAAIAAGGLLSAAFSPAPLMFASTTAFLLSELADFAVFAPLRRRGFFIAAFFSSLVGLVVDSGIFLMLAFGSLDYLAGQILGKLWMVATTLAIWLLVRRPAEVMQSVSDQA